MFELEKYGKSKHGGWYVEYWIVCAPYGAQWDCEYFTDYSWLKKWAYKHGVQLDQKWRRDN